MGETTHQIVGERLRVGGRNDSRNGGRNDSGAKRLRAKRQGERESGRNDPLPAMRLWYILHRSNMYARTFVGRKLRLFPCSVCASSVSSGETVRMRMLASLSWSPR